MSYVPYVPYLSKVLAGPMVLTSPMRLYMLKIDGLHVLQVSKKYHMHKIWRVIDARKPNSKKLWGKIYVK